MTWNTFCSRVTILNHHSNYKGELFCIFTLFKKYLDLVSRIQIIFINGYGSNLMDVVITQKAFGRISGQKLIKFEPDSVCPSFATTLQTNFLALLKKVYFFLLKKHVQFEVAVLDTSQRFLKIPHLQAHKSCSQGCRCAIVGLFFMIVEN